MKHQFNQSQTKYIRLIPLEMILELEEFVLETYTFNLQTLKKEIRSFHLGPNDGFVKIDSNKHLPVLLNERFQIVTFCGNLYIRDMQDARFVFWLIASYGYVQSAFWSQKHNLVITYDPVFYNEQLNSYVEQLNIYCIKKNQTLHLFHLNGKKQEKIYFEVYYPFIRVGHSNRIHQEFVVNIDVSGSVELNLIWNCSDNDQDNLLRFPENFNLQMTKSEQIECQRLENFSTQLANFHLKINSSSVVFYSNRFKQQLIKPQLKQKVMDLLESISIERMIRCVQYKLQEIKSKQNNLDIIISAFDSTSLGGIQNLVDVVTSYMWDPPIEEFEPMNPKLISILKNLESYIE